MKEIISLTLAVIFQSSDISAINMLGLVICMTGITLHVLRKASSVEARGSTERSSRRGPRGSPGQKESLLSQSESDDDSEVEVFHTSRWTFFARARFSMIRQQILFCPQIHSPINTFRGTFHAGSQTMDWGEIVLR